MLRTFTWLLAVSIAVPALAGGGPENVLLVVNPKSEASVTIAEHYAKLRKVPARCVVAVPWEPTDETTDVDTFRQKILAPVLANIQARGLAPQIDCVVYSADFPWAVDLKPDVKRFLKSQTSSKEQAEADGPPGDQQADRPAQPVDAKWPRHLTQTGSLTGLTYLYQRVLTGNPRTYMDLHANQYMRRAIPEQEESPTLGFHSGQQFGPHGEPVEEGGVSYLLSMMLGVTAGRGNTVEEVLAYLDRAAASDGTHPKGTIYYVENRNIRSKTRDRAFPAAVEELGKLGVAAEIVQGVVPQKKPDVQGAMLGTATFDWKASGSTILPGAICEHLTSFGGVMRAKAGQTPLSEFLRFGAAASCGTVTEPFALQAKFPFAMIHVHYARGCTAAEAFYQSVYGPYQLLIVGDPLCRPWANVPKVTVEDTPEEEITDGRLTIRPSATVPGDRGVGRFELFVDGRRAAACEPGGTFTLDVGTLPDGPHELRVVAVEAGPIASQGRAILVVGVKHAQAEEE